MKNVYALFVSILISSSVFAAGYVTKSFSFGGATRQYLLYVPASYDGTTPYPFVLALHGLGDNMNNFKGINMNAVADTANFILAVPQALVDNVITGQTAWNSGAGAFGVSLNASVDDVGFLNALLDTVSANYNVDQTRIYSTGFSMGGFMSNRLACELNNRVAAIASVSGTIGGVLNCQPARAVPAAHFHGTADQTVNYTGNQFGSDAEPTARFWINHNHCDTTPSSIDTFPDVANDGKVVVHYKYPNGDYNTRVEFFKVIGGAHEWLGPIGNDINYAVEIWRFFRDFKWETQTSGLNNTTTDANVRVYPNPASSFIQVELPTNYSVATISLCDLSGKCLLSLNKPQNNGNLTLPLTNLVPGIYLLHINANGNPITKKVVVAE